MSRFSQKMVIGFHLIGKAHITPQMAVVLYAVWRSPGASFSDIGGKIGHGRQSSVFKAVTRLIGRGLVEDLRPSGYAEKTPGILNVTPAGDKLMREIFDDETDGALSADL